MSEFNNILLFAGETKSENIPMGYFSSLAMITLRGKPIIWWQLDNLKNQGINDFILVLNKNNMKLVDYVKNVLLKSFEIKIVLVNNKESILNSFKQGLKIANPKVPTRLILGDTLISKSISNETDILYTSKNISFSDYWCLVSKKDGIIDKFYDKQSNLNLMDKEAIIGYYSFSNTKFINSCVKKAHLFSKIELSDALNLYKKKINLKTKLISDWYDLGHTNGLIEAKNLLFNVRSFNSIKVDTDSGTLTKISTKIQKLEDEAMWYKTLPNELQILTPRLISFKKDAIHAELVQELYGYPSLSELFISGAVNLEDWKFILKKLFKLHKKFEQYESKKDEQAITWLYIEKTRERIKELKAQNPLLNELLNKATLKINGKNYCNISLLEEKINDSVKRISHNATISIMHGDYCFSNILFDASNYTFKLIDPRGRLNGNATVYGDSRYDIAKLRHSVCGLYDFIVNGLFNFEENNDGFKYEILASSEYSKLETTFDDLAQKNGFNIIEIKLIEGLLFLSMIPLHKDDIKRQKMFYLKSIILFNNIFNDQEYIKKSKNQDMEIFPNPLNFI